MPVVTTATKNSPSKRGSRDSLARSQISDAGNIRFSGASPRQARHYTGGTPQRLAGIGHDAHLPRQRHRSGRSPDEGSDPDASSDSDASSDAGTAPGLAESAGHRKPGTGVPDRQR